MLSIPYPTSPCALPENYPTALPYSDFSSADELPSGIDSFASDTGNRMSFYFTIFIFLPTSNQSKIQYRLDIFPSVTF